MPREFTNISTILAYIPPDANYKDSTEKLVDVINKLEDKSPDAVKVVLCYFNGCKFDEHIP